jgi:hypothetical protein
MKTLSRTVRNVIAGLVLAGAMSLSASRVSAFSCEANISCEGIGLGVPMSCECSGAGSCSHVSQEEIRCACQGFDTVICTCDNGCG